MKTICLSLMLLMLFCSAASAKTTVFFKNGEALDAKSVWREGDTVFVLVNRDILVDFPKTEVNLKKTKVKKRTVAGKQSRLLDQILELTALRKQLDEFATAFSSSGDEDNPIASLMRESYSSAAAWKTVRRHLARNLDDKTLSDVLNFYKTPTGRLIAQFTSQPDPDREQNMEAFFSQEGTPELEKKAELGTQIEAEAGTSDFELWFFKKLTTAMIDAIPANLPGREQLRDEMKKEVPSLENTRNKNLAHTVYKYRTLSPEQLEEYLAFLRSPSGRKFNRVYLKAVEKMLTDFVGTFKTKFHAALVDKMNGKDDAVSSN